MNQHMHIWSLLSFDKSARTLNNKRIVTSVNRAGSLNKYSHIKLKPYYHHYIKNVSSKLIKGFTDQKPSSSTRKYEDKLCDVSLGNSVFCFLLFGRFCLFVES